MAESNTEYFPGKNVPPNHFYLSCSNENSTLVGFKQDFPEGASWHPKPFMTTCPILGLTKVPTPEYFLAEAGGELHPLWKKIEAAQELLLGEHDGLCRMHVCDWKEIFGDDPTEEWGWGESRFVYYLLSDHPNIYRLHMAFE